jgi:hypothetical protein
MLEIPQLDSAEHDHVTIEHSARLATKLVLPG